MKLLWKVLTNSNTSASGCALIYLASFINTKFSPGSVKLTRERSRFLTREIPKVFAYKSGRFLVGQALTVNMSAPRSVAIP